MNGIFVSIYFHIYFSLSIVMYFIGLAYDTLLICPWNAGVEQSPTGTKHFVVQNENCNGLKVMGRFYFIKMLKWAVPSKGYKVEATSCRLG